MKIGIVGATGKAGSLILQEAAHRGHDVTAIVRDASKLQDKSIPVIEKDIFDLKREDLQSFDVIVNAFGAPLGEEQAHVDVGRVFIQALKGTKTRFIVVGGAGSLFVDESKTVRLMDTPDFPEIVKPTAKGQGRNLQELLQTTDLIWTFVSPSAFFDAQGKKTGAYKVGEDSYADFAIAIVDEIENPKHLNKRFTVVGESE